MRVRRKTVVTTVVATVFGLFVFGLGLALTSASLVALHAAGRELGERYELVVVDDASTDGTALVAQRHGALLVSVAHRQIAATRNSGARAANGELLSTFTLKSAATVANRPTRPAWTRSGRTAAYPTRSRGGPAQRSV